MNAADRTSRLKMTKINPKWATRVGVRVIAGRGTLPLRGQAP
jgi:hypothetical protein